MGELVNFLSLENFRSHETFKADFSGQDLILITGKNGSGKTSLLEAIHLLLRGKSFRTVKPELLLRRAASNCRAEIGLTSGERVFFYDSEKKEKTFISGGDKKRTLARAKNVPTIVFEGDDLILLASTPSVRRKYLDNLLSQIYPSYYYARSRHRRALAQRNIALKAERAPSRDELLGWDGLIIKYGLEIVREREKVVGEINARITEVYRKIAGNSDQVGVKFTTEIAEQSAGWWQEELVKRYPIDRAAGRTTFGLQHDDFVFYFNGERAASVASRGEVRTMIVALKFIEAEIVESVFSSPPIILLDDVFSELDESRQKALLKNFKKNQIFITATHPPKGMKAGYILP